MKITATVHQSAEFKAFMQHLGSPRVRDAAAKGLTEHAQEQRRGSIARIVASTGVPRGRVSKMRVIKAGTGATMEAKIRISDTAIGLHEYGNPVWVRDLNPMADGKRGGSVSSMKGAEATGWNVRRQFPGAFMANGRVVVRTTKNRTPLKTLSMAVLANELAKPTRPNVPAAEAYAAIDLQKRVLRHVLLALGV